MKKLIIMVLVAAFSLATSAQTRPDTLRKKMEKKALPKKKWPKKNDTSRRDTMRRDTSRRMPPM